PAPGGQVPLRPGQPRAESGPPDPPPAVRRARRSAFRRRARLVRALLTPFERVPRSEVPWTEPVISLWRGTYCFWGWCTGRSTEPLTRLPAASPRRRGEAETSRRRAVKSYPVP